MQTERATSVATTVIEVGVNVPIASVMVIESAERFQPVGCINAGRVGRGAEQDVLMTGNELSKDGRRRLEPCAARTMGLNWPRWIWNCAAPAI